ncbi:hypothetical protein ACFOEM_08320 [Paenalcaligenes hominis]
MFSGFSKIPLIRSMWVLAILAMSSTHSSQCRRFPTFSTSLA